MYSTSKELLAEFHKQPQCVKLSDHAGLAEILWPPKTILREKRLK